MNHHALKMITGATLIDPLGQTTESGALLIEGPRIHSIHPTAPASLLLNYENVEVVSGQNCYLTPGLIELHMNGAFGYDLNHGGIADVQAMLERLPRLGITATLLTVITATAFDMLTAVNTLEEVIHYKNPHHARPLGIHLEGPFLSPQYRGVHPREAVRPPILDDLLPLLSPHVRMVTLAPEADPDGQAIAELVQRGIVVSAGHTNATLDEFEQAVQQGLCSATHLFNAMRPIHHREPGAIIGALNNDHVTVQFIGDGVHVHPAVLRTLINAKGLEKLVLVSDSLPLAGLPDGSEMQFAGQRVTLRNGQILNPEGRLAGSGLLLDDCLKNLVRWGLVSFGQAIQLASRNAASLLGEHQLGRIEPGRTADLVLWNKDTLEVEATWINGELVYQRQTAAQHIS